VNLIINLNWREAAHVAMMLDVNNPTLPVELLYIADDLQRNGIDYDFLDLWAENRTLQDFEEKITNCDFIILSTAPTYCYWRSGTLDAELSKRMIKKIKNIAGKAKIILIGPHSIIETFSEVDFVVKGEPELVISKIIKGEDVNLNQFHTVSDLDDLPCLTFSQIDDFRKYHLFPITAERPDEGFRPAVMYETGRGCPYNCIFCFKEGFRGAYREKSLGRIEAETNILKKRNVKYVFLIDECFDLNKKWALKVAKILKRNNLYWGCHSNPGNVTPEWIDKIAENNCKGVYLGLEAIDKDISKTLGKRIDDSDGIKANLEYLFSKDISVFLSFIIGSPGETESTIKELKRFILDLPLDRFNVNVYTMIPYPHTKIWQMGIQEGKDLSSWKDVKKYAGIIGNDLSQAYIKRQERIINTHAYMNKNKNILKMPFYYLALLAPNLFYKLYYYFTSKRW
jgi:radical SAM superfamily enzyme YgiQ (UPF0313 family)